MASPAPAATAAAQVQLDPQQVARVELALLVAPHGTDPGIVLDLPIPTAQRVRAAGVATLHDEETTPIARLVLAAADPSAPDSSVASVASQDSNQPDLLAGTLQPMRRRESGALVGHRLTSEDLSSDQARSIVVLARPPMEADTAAVRHVAGAAPDLLVLVPELTAPGTPPAEILLRAAQGYLSGLGVAAVVRVAPLDFTGVGTSGVTELADAAGATSVLLLAEHDGSAGAQAWQDARGALGTGDQTGLTGLDPAVLTAVQRWRPPRSRRGLVLLFTGLSGSGKSTLARDLSRWLSEHSTRTVTLLDGDVVRQMLSAGLGFDRASRELNVARIGFVGATIAAHGGIAICAPIAPYAQMRERMRAMAEAVGDFVLIHVNTPLAECERRDLKGLYARARAGQIPEFTGISDPYEEPQDADLRIDTSRDEPAEALSMVTDYLQAGGWLGAPGGVGR